jgi:peptidoglycan/xylan/chitin deacetylase (PgdA/CDA1 family)
MDWDMVRALQKNGFEMQAHTHTHADIRTLSLEDMQREVQASGEHFADELGVKPCAICLPFGTYDRRSVRRLKRAGGYKYILASYYGRAGKRKCKKGGLLPRIGISDTDGIEVFEKKLKGKLSWKGPLQRARLFLHNLKGDRIEKYEY